GGAMFRLRAVFLSQQQACRLMVLLLTLGLAASAAAQGERGVIGGTVADAQGGVLPGVTVTARNSNTGFIQTAVTEADGKYRFGALPLGTYAIKAELVGFSTATVTNLTITINRELQQNITMGLSTLQESVTVTGQAPVVEVTKSEVSSVITRQQIEMLPVANRAAVTLALLLPGTSQDGTRPRRSNAQVGAGTLQFTTRTTRHQAGAALGGPIVMNKVHFFTAYEYTQENSSYAVTTGAPQFYGKYEGVFDQKLPNRLFFARSDAQLTSKQSGFVRW